MLRASRAHLLVLVLANAACGEPAAGTSDSTAQTSTADGSSTGAGTSSTTTLDDPTTTSTASTATTTTDGTTEVTGTTAPPEPFTLDCHTEFAGPQQLALVCNLPRELAACQRVPGAPCEDVDLDGLTDAWEDLALALLHPLRRLDEDESLVDDADAVLADVGRVAPAGDRVRLFIMLGYSRDYGSCGGFTGHNGDSERVALDLRPDPERGPGGAVVVRAYTAAHEGTTSDHGRVFDEGALTELVFTVDPDTADPRWVVFPSADKHATYASVPICEGISVIPCFDEDCGPDGVPDPAVYERLPEIANAGEEAAPRLTDLSAIGFPGDDAWAEQDFCGGLGGTGCSSPVREKLLVDPFP